MKRRGSLENVGIGLVIITIIGLVLIFVFFNNGFLPTIDPEITDNTSMTIRKYRTPPANAMNIVNVSETQISQCEKLKTAIQEIINKNDEMVSFKLNTSDYNCIFSFLESLSTSDDPPYLYFSGFYFLIFFKAS